MDAFLEFLSSKSKFKDRLFVSETPGPVFLIWSDFKKLPKISGITCVYQLDTVNKYSEVAKQISKVLRENITSKIPIIEVGYDDTASKFLIDDEETDSDGAANKISESLKISLGKNAAKKPNDPSQIKDPFHVWSRSVFDGITVRKVDIDAFILSEDHNKISAIIEIKRSKKIPIGKWLPYIDPKGQNTDYWNYVMGFTTCKLLNCDFITFHHEILDASTTFKIDTPVEAFAFKSTTLISSETIIHFGSNANRSNHTGQNFIST